MILTTYDFTSRVNSESCTFGKDKQGLLGDKLKCLYSVLCLQNAIFVPETCYNKKYPIFGSLPLITNESKALKTIICSLKCRIYE
jgi:hypothetical protein